jgi:hypothetical protein
LLANLTKKLKFRLAWVGFFIKFVTIAEVLHKKNGYDF